MTSYRAKPPYGSPLNRADPLAKGLVAAYLLNEVSGLTARDSARGPAGSGTLSAGVTWAGGPFGRCLAFDGGASTRVDLPYSAGLNTNTFSLSCRVKTTAAAVQAVIDRDPETGNRPWQFRLSAAGLVQFISVAGGSLSGSTAVNDGRWHQIGATLDATAVTLFVDGQADASGSVTAPTASATAGLTLGLNGSVAGGWAIPFTGSIDAPAHWRRVLSAAEVRALAADPFRMFRRRRVPVPLHATVAAVKARRTLSGRVGSRGAV